MLDFYDQEGNKQVDNGNGTWKTFFYANTKPVGILKATFKDGKRYGKWKFYGNHDKEYPLYTEKYKDGKLKVIRGGLVTPKVRYTKFEAGINLNIIDAFILDEQVTKQKNVGVLFPISYFKKKPDIRLDIEAFPIDSTDQKIYKRTKETPPTQPTIGLMQMYRRIAKLLRYPVQARRKNKQGRIFVSFVIEKDGSMSSFKASNSISKSLDAEAIRVCKLLSTKFTPMVFNGKRVRSKASIPIMFQLR